MKKVLLFGMILLCLSLPVVMSCNDNSTSDDDDDADSGQDQDDDNDNSDPAECDDDTAYDPNLCDGNVPPVPLAAKIAINGVVIETPVTIHWDDTVMVYLEYEDENCNLGGGNAYLLMPDGIMFWREEGLPDGVGCSSAEAGEPLTLEVSPSFFWQQPVSIGLVDSCVGYSEATIPLDITTVEY